VTVHTDRTPREAGQDDGAGSYADRDEDHLEDDGQDAGRLGDGGGDGLDHRSADEDEGGDAGQASGATTATTAAVTAAFAVETFAFHRVTCRLWQLQPHELRSSSQPHPGHCP
jgi:hypothetical protein